MKNIPPYDIIFVDSSGISKLYTVLYKEDDNSPNAVTHFIIQLRLVIWKYFKKSMLFEYTTTAWGCSKSNTVENRQVA